MKIIERISKAASDTQFKASCDQVLSAIDPYSRSTKAGHITASGLVIREGRALLIFHPYIKAWFQPGGHIDDGESPIDAAIREVYEETGVACKPIDRYLDPIDIDLHEIPANPLKGESAHLHIDLLFLLDVVAEGVSTEGIQKIWLTVGEVSNTRLRRVFNMLRN
jgi:8-oxo-dGTP pyrophosphatase MutT (NUDIX family)